MNDSIYKLMGKMPHEWTRRWCEPDELGCACLGCANHSGGLLKNGYTKEDWQEYLKQELVDEDETRV